MSGVTPSRIVGSKKYGARSGRARPPVRTTGTLGDRVVDVRLHRVELLLGDQRPMSLPQSSVAPSVIASVRATNRSTNRS